MMKKKPAQPAPYDHLKVEKKWQKKWASTKADVAKEKPDMKKFYSLIEFPYPSGDGLHVGHIRSNTAMDIISRKRRREGFNVLYPIGWDAFGLPTENYAIKTGIQPAIVTKKNTDTFRRQLKELGFSFDWSREIDTTDPKYYKWTQWIFLQFLKQGLAYKKKMSINWCPKDLIGLANEEVVGGRCERCGTPVEKREKEQWMLAITKYAERLLNDLDAVDDSMPKLVDEKNPHQQGKPLVERKVVHAIVFDPKTKKYLIIRNKKHGWDTVIIGGIEGNEDAVTAAKREVREETGYTDIEFKRLLGGQVETHFYAKHKGVNRIAYTQGAYFELKSDAHVPIAEGEDKDDEVLWIDAKDFIPGKMVNSEMELWLERIADPKKGWPKPLLDWPESIKELQRNWIGKSEGAEIDFRLTMTKNKTRFVILHGYTGRADKNFIPWLKKTLEDRGHEVEAPELPNTKEPKELEQVEYALKNCRFDENTVVIGHSLGAVVALKALMKLSKQISGLVLVAPAIDPKFHDADSRPFWKDFTWGFDYAQIKKLTGGKIAVLSDTQEQFRAPYLKYLAEQLSALLIESRAAREHFCALEEPAVLNAITPSVKVFTTRPDTLFGVTYIVLAPEHPWIGELLTHVENKAEVNAYISKTKSETEIQRTDATKEKTGVELKGIKAINPANGEEVPVWIADYVLADYGTGAVMAVPAHDERDYAFAKKFNLQIREVISGGDVSKEAFTGNGALTNSNSFNGKNSESVKKEITESVGGQWITKYKLRDWIFSRQRYWGEPIPVIHCDTCGSVPVPEKDLPVKLPKVKNYAPTKTGESPLAAIEKWVKVRCPSCKGWAKRETDTMPNWAGSSWYYLRYTDPKNNKRFADPKNLDYWTPVDWYNGGMEHTTLHLLYSRFWHKFLFDQGLVPTREPYTKRTSHGLILAEGGVKMSKSKGNVINPDTIVKSVGADTLRVYEMFMGPFDQSIAWDTNNIAGSRRFIERVWKLAEKVSDGAPDHSKVIHKAIKKVSDDIEAMRFNTAISTLMIALNELEKSPSVSQTDYEALIMLLAPFAPHVTEELWSMLGNKKSIHASGWPVYNPALAADNEVNIIVQVNGKMRASFTAAAGTSKDKLLRMALDLPETKKWLEGKAVKKEIVVPDRLVNIVV